VHLPMGVWRSGGTRVERARVRGTRVYGQRGRGRDDFPPRSLLPLMGVAVQECRMHAAAGAGLVPVQPRTWWHSVAHGAQSTPVISRLCP
jgi:hypothetical protein